MASVFLPLLIGYFTLVGALNNNPIDMEEEELLGLFDVMGSLLEDTKWAQMHPQPCTETPWPGIECKLEANFKQVFHVTKIHIDPYISPPCKPSASLSKSIASLPFLKTISIFNCFTSSPVSIHPSLFANLSFLENVVLQSNPNLTGEIPSSLATAGSLKTLCLKQNSLSGEIPKGIGGLGSLEQLDLSFNNLSGCIPQEFGGLLSLSILDLSWNHLEGKLPTSLGHLQLLQKMDLGFNMIKGTIPIELGHLGSLVLLDLSHNQLNGPIPSQLSKLGNLEYFVIDHNPINSYLPLFLGTLVKLKTLGLSSCGLIGPISTPFFNLKCLSSLSLDNNSLSGEIPTSLGSLANLRELNLSQNQFSGKLSLPEKFIYRLGERLDVKRNNGLCGAHSNASMWLGIPDCYLTSRDTENKTCVKDDSLKPHGGSCSINQRMKKQLVVWILIMFYCII